MSPVTYTAIIKTFFHMTAASEFADYIIISVKMDSYEKHTGYPTPS